MCIRAAVYRALLLVASLCSGVCIGHAEVYETKPSQVDQEVLTVIYSGNETLHYTVTWSGGVKIGDIRMTIRRQPGKADTYEILAKITDAGPLELLYPVDDTFSCLVAGPMKLPYLYTVHQKEGFRREIHRRTRYDQAKRQVWYQKNKETEQQFDIAGSTYNEFASFIITRALMFREGEPIIIPTFADKKRHDVKVMAVRREKRATLFGDKNTLVVQPQMQFKGLYEKSGNTTLWLTDDRCRVPVEIHSKIVIGALVAELVEYTNPACPEMARVQDR
jgi:hypothetical protein